MLRTCLVALIALLSVPVFAQNPITADSPFQVRYAANLNVYDSVIDITNTGASNNNICTNVYVFDPAEEEIACCSCTVTPNALVSMSVKNDLISNPLTPALPTSVVVKLVASAQPGVCNASSVTSLTSGLAAWMTTTHPITTTTTSPNWWVKPVTTTTVSLEETPFTPSTLSAGELTRITNQCGFIQSNGSGFGICRGCTIGGK